eukprot:1362206-Amorphochlora_amoeboformis.AAC.1
MSHTHVTHCYPNKRLSSLLALHGDGRPNSPFFFSLPSRFSRIGPPLTPYGKDKGKRSFHEEARTLGRGGEGERGRRERERGESEERGGRVE